VYGAYPSGYAPYTERCVELIQTYLNSNNQGKYRLEVGGKFILYDKESKKINIVTNSRFLYKWALLFLTFGILVTIGVLIMTPAWPISLRGPLLLVPFTYFAFWAHKYYRKATRIENLIVDISNRNLEISTLEEYHFSQITHLFITMLPSKDMDSPNSYQLNVLFSDENELMLCSTENFQRLKQAAKFLSVKMGVKLKEEIDPA